MVWLFPGHVQFVCLTHSDPKFTCEAQRNWFDDLHHRSWYRMSVKFNAQQNVAVYRLKWTLQSFDLPSCCWATTQKYLQRILSWPWADVFLLPRKYYRSRHHKSISCGKRVVQRAPVGSKKAQNNSKHLWPGRRILLQHLWCQLDLHSESWQPKASSSLDHNFRTFDDYRTINLFSKSGTIQIAFNRPGSRSGPSPKFKTQKWAAN